MKSGKKVAPEFNQASLGAALKKEGFDLSSNQLNQLWKFHTYLRKRNPELNMTRIHSFTTIVRKHYIDCMIVLRFLDEAGIELKGRLMDLGSGPGFPGVPLSIMRPDLHLVLAEGRHKRVEFLGEVVDMLGLNASVFGNRVHAGQGQDVQGVITRAVENMAATLRHCQGNTTEEALFIFMKGPNCDQEIAEVQALGECDLLLDKSYTLPESTDHRRLVVWKQKAMVAGEWISSTDNKKFKLLKSLHQVRQIRKQSQCLVSGEKVINEFVHTYPDRCLAIVVAGQMQLPQALQSQQSIPLWRFAPGLYKELDTQGTGRPLLLFQVSEFEKLDLINLPSGRLIVLPLSDPENLGAALRSAAAFKPDGIVLTEESAHPFHPRALRAASGQSLKVPIYKTDSLEDLCVRLNQSARPVLALDMQGEDIAAVNFPEDCLLILGEEGRGLPAEFKGQRIAIPMDGAVESLNASVALGIVLYVMSGK